MAENLERATFSFYLFDGAEPRASVFTQTPVEGARVPRLEEVRIHLQEVTEEDPRARLKEVLIQVIEHL